MSGSRLAMATHSGADTTRDTAQWTESSESDEQELGQGQKWYQQAQGYGCGQGPASLGRGKPTAPWPSSRNGPRPTWLHHEGDKGRREGPRMTWAAGLQPSPARLGCSLLAVSSQAQIS